MAGAGDWAVAQTINRQQGYLANNYNPGDYGAAQGLLAAQENQRANNQDVRQERILGMAEEKFSWDREAHQKEMTLQAGMAKAAQDGGYEGVISFLQNADPERALKFQDAKLDLDAKIMTNDVMKNIKVPELQQNALLESYSKLGQMGAAILKAPAQDREAMYQQFLPIAKVINPSMPDNLQAAAPTLLLAAAQATPANLFFKADKDNFDAASNVGKNGQDIVALRKLGFSPGDGTPEGDTLTTLLAEQGRFQMQSAITGAKLTAEQLKPMDKLYEGTTTMSDNLAKASIITPKYTQTYSTMMGALNTLATDPTNSQAMSNLLGAFTKANAGGNPSDYDSKLQQGARSYEALEQKVKEMLSGRAQPLTPTDISNLRTLIGNVNDEYLSMQTNIENQFADTAKAFPKQVDWNNVVKPSQNFAKAQQENTANAQLVNGGQIPPDIQARAQWALSQGVPKDVVNAQVQKDIAARAQQYQQTVSPTITPQDYAGD